MPETTHGLRLQASHATIMNARVIEEMEVMLNKADGETLEVSVDVISVAIMRLKNDNLVMSKMALKIDDFVTALENIANNT